MEQITYEQVQEFLTDNYPGIESCKINTKDLVFEERVKMSCFFCARYGHNWKCPPKLPSIDYEKMFSEFDNAAFVWIKMPLTEGNYNDVRNDSSVIVHKVLLDLERYLLNNGSPIYLSFIGGSCKLCKNGCGKDKCNNPYLARSPLEATGINVVKSAQKYGIEITFPAKRDMIRLGMILW